MKANILIVEDNVEFAQLMKEHLEENGFQVEWCDNGEDAFVLGLKEWDLILLDIILPKRDGLQVCVELRNQNIDTPIIFLTAFGHESVIETGLSIGADDFIVKPFVLDTFVARVKGYIHRHRLRQQPKSHQHRSTEAITFPEGLEIDPAKASVKRNNEVIELKAMEWKLLQFLSSHPGRIFSKEELYNRVWGEEAVGVDNTVTVHIRRLRKKIEADPKSPRYILTRRGIGYCFSDK
ncbi:response regulator transcription factor [Evansella tamaricis]|uniref:Response regulator transcription factor n=1 Tax=Evansella tamaricis TaxID=2069301 RepID=A0ABS6JGH0_9BACI|nr:response regulator transcription factor [Evansella tamaricis]MBU9711937.1 response regulator transcription factor [Evansella tamaricis]